MSADKLPTTLAEWLKYIGQTHSAEIEMGLRRVSTVAERLGVTKPAPVSVIIAGTNGKGSTTIALEALLIAAGVNVGTTLSPHVLQFNERIRLRGELSDDADLCRAFAAVDAARQEIPLTYFEFATLAALWLFAQENVQVALLEVGLGGRLDAFNLVDAQVAIITSIGLDHQAFLGDNLDSIGREKAGVLRQQQTAVLGQDLPTSIATHAQQLGTQTLTLGQDFSLAALAADRWCTTTAGGQSVAFAHGRFVPSNCALAAQAAEVVVQMLPPNSQQSPASWVTTAESALASAQLPGRFQPLVYRGRNWRLDVGHNPLAAQCLVQQLRTHCPKQRVIALFGQLQDKDSPQVVAPLRDRVAHWVLVPTRGARAQSAKELETKLLGAPQPLANVESAQSFDDGMAQALAHCGPRDVILAFGAFNVVEEVLLRLPGDS